MREISALDRKTRSRPLFGVSSNIVASHTSAHRGNAGSLLGTPSMASSTALVTVRRGDRRLISFCSTVLLLLDCSSVGTLSPLEEWFPLIASPADDDSG